MSLLTVPYNNAMALGQGFNTYTQSLCLDKAVLYKTDTNKDVKPEKISQIVTYSSHFVEKLSDVVKALNVSAALAVKCGTVTGSGSGSYVDEDKIKQSEINFIITVKVTNQTMTMPGEGQLNVIEGVDRSKFTEIYGDTFISGFLTGGEFTAIVSVKVSDSNKVKDIKAELEVNFSSIQAKGKGGYVDSALAKDTETSITVNWSGGGKIKERDVAWDIKSMMAAAFAFPELCAECPQRTSAILTKYTGLSSFLKTWKFDTLSYDNAGVYTADLLDDYMDYKMQWKTVRLMAGEIHLYEQSKHPSAYPATVEGIDLARREILKQMVFIVNEVDIVRVKPEHAQEALMKGTPVYINPHVLEARLPVKIPVSAPPPPVAPPTTPSTPPDPKTWMWVKVPGVDSNGNDVKNSVTGTPEELMVEIYAWEVANPGKYIKAFNSLGSFKTKCLHPKEFTTSQGCDLYIRVLIDDNWIFSPGVDSRGSDIQADGFVQQTDAEASDIDIVDSIDRCKERADIVAFNTLGKAKGHVSLPLIPNEYSQEKRPHHGIWVRKSSLHILAK